jgi:hypothetical protein
MTCFKTIRDLAPTTRRQLTTQPWSSIIAVRGFISFTEPEQRTRPYADANQTEAVISPGVATTSRSTAAALVTVGLGARQPCGL